MTYVGNNIMTYVGNIKNIPIDNINENREACIIFSFQCI